MALSKFTGDEAYKKLIRDSELTPRTYKDVAEDWELNKGVVSCTHCNRRLVDGTRDSIAQDLRVVSLQDR